MKSILCKTNKDFKFQCIRKRMIEETAWLRQQQKVLGNYRTVTNEVCVAQETAGQASARRM